MSFQSSKEIDQTLQSIPTHSFNLKINHATLNDQIQEENICFIKQKEGQLNSLRQYGNSIVVIDNPSFTVIIGPDYLCFLPTFLTFMILSIFIIRFVQSHSSSDVLIIFAYIICLSQPFSYLLVAISDPGIAHPSSIAQQYRFCRRCAFNVPFGCLHCSSCDRCIIGYDHHCPWTSKCIGRNNLIRFYVFLCLTPIWMVFCAVAAGLTIQSSEKQMVNY